MTKRWSFLPYLPCLNFYFFIYFFVLFRWLRRGCVCVRVRGSWTCRVFINYYYGRFVRLFVSAGLWGSQWSLAWVEQANI